MSGTGMSRFMLHARVHLCMLPMPKYTRVYVRLCMCACMCMLACMRVDVLVCMDLCAHVYMGLCEYHLCAHACMRVCVYVRVCV